jgi:predicted SnoaL-like aldol condensation-catalyzing enzyme
VLTWKHIHSEYTQDVHQIAATLATDAPLAWTLAREGDREGSWRFLAGTTVDEIRGQYETLREAIEIHGWNALIEIRQGWYTLTHGVVTLKQVPTGLMTQSETVALFPVGYDGILGELQIGTVGRLPDGRTPSDNGQQPPHARLAALLAHDAYIEALRTENVDQIMAAHSPNGAVAIRSYLTDVSSLLNTSDIDEVREYFTALFHRYRVRDIQLVNRVAEAWYVFAELHWIVEERGDAGRTLEFCTAEMSPLDPEGKYWIRTGAGTDPIEP